MSLKNHYDKNYFNWQRPLGEFGGWANLAKFEDYIREDYNVIDFGCGGGFLLKTIKCKNKIGVELNEEARRFASKIGIKTVKKVEKIKDSWADLIISNNTLEHTLNPLKELIKLHKKLKKGGLIIFIVPCESVSYDYQKNDINHHLYSWSPMCIGNLFTEAGFKVIRSEHYKYKWPPFHKKIAELFGRNVFNFLSRLCGQFSRSWHQVRIIAKK